MLVLTRKGVEGQRTMRVEATPGGAIVQPPGHPQGSDPGANPQGGARSGKLIIRGEEVPELAFDASSTRMAREAGRIFLEKTQGWPAADKAAFWQSLATQIEAHHSPAWVSFPLRGSDGEYVFSGRMIGVHGMVIDKNGGVFLIGKDVDVRINWANLTVSVTPKLPPAP